MNLLLIDKLDLYIIIKVQNASWEGVLPIMNLMQLYYFRTLAKTEHYSRAAEELNISQSALSQSINLLECELQTYFFEKQGRNVVLTKSGKIFLKYVDSALSILEEGKEELRKLNTLENSKISLGFISGVGHFVPGVISCFLKELPGCNILFTCSEGTTDELIKKLKDDKYDLVMCSKRDSEQYVEFLPIIEGRLVVLLPENHVLAGKKELRLKDIYNFPFVMHTTGSGMRTLAEEFFSKAGLKPQIVMEAQDDVMIAKLVESDHGIALITDMPEIKKFKIKIIPLAEPEARRFIYLASMKNRCLHPAALAFKSYIINKYVLRENEGL